MQKQLLIDSVKGASSDRRELHKRYNALNVNVLTQTYHKRETIDDDISNTQQGTISKKNEYARKMDSP